MDIRPTAPQYVTLTTPGGYGMHATITLDWGQGAALYRIAELKGTITVGWESGHYHHDCCDGDSMEITYGKPERSPFIHHFEDSPTVFGVQLADRASFHAEAMKPTGPWWLVVRRESGGTYAPEAPEGTRRRTAAIVYTITRHMLSRPWAAELRRAHDQEHAPARHRRHQEAIREMETEAAALQEKLSRERGRAAVQAALIGTGSAVASVTPLADPADLQQLLAA
ncbi:hypothetical protein [Streptacidiphilus albus]|uniref:hypothetical protein n=1 Tax=Streptacidiphilus albus TaxID=105425 RepID=UPI00128C9FAE|nr:hypothetical protein [Streptacidiphilus albus]